MGYDLVVRDRRQDIFHRSDHGHAEFETCGMRSDSSSFHLAGELSDLLPCTFDPPVCMHDVIIMFNTGLCGCAWSFGCHDCALCCHGLGSSIPGSVSS